MKKLLLSVIFISGTQLYGAAGPECEISSEELEKKRSDALIIIKQVMHIPQRNEYHQKMKELANYYEDNHVEALNFSWSILALDHEQEILKQLKEAQDDEAISLTQQKALAINKLGVEIFDLLLKNAWKAEDLVKATTESGLSKIMN